MVAEGDKINLNGKVLKENLPATGLMVLFMLALICIVDKELINLPNIIFSVFLALASVLDIKYLMLFNRVTYSMMATGLVVGIITLATTGDKSLLSGSLIYITVCGGILAVISICYPGGMGGGDIKFAGAIGGWLADERGILAVLLSFWIGAVIAGLYLILCRDADRKLKIPFGPFLSAGAFIALLWGREIFSWYWSG